MSIAIRRFAASWSLMTWLITLLVIVVVIIVCGAALTQAEKGSSQDVGERVSLVAVALIVPVILMASALFAPLGFTVDQAGIVVNRMGPRICIPHSEITEIRRLARRDVGFSIRLAGSGGFLGSYGRIWSTRLGKHRAYVTSSKDLVLICCRDGVKFLLSPYPAEVFIEAVDQAGHLSGFDRKTQRPIKQANQKGR